ncbi:MAG: acyl carrier protein [Oscillospiraceae bacterium]|nr:acyl carrier protein [Oscillospiraceae bacterium]
MEISKEIYDYIVKEYNIEVDEDFTADVNLFDYGYVDSLDAMAIIAYIETNFGIEVTQRDLMLHPMNTINELAAFVSSKTGT